VALMEAMAMGVPVVTTPVSGIPELVEAGRTGVLVESGDAEGLADAVENLLKDRNSAKEMAAAARETLEQAFDIDSNASQLLARFREVSHDDHRAN